VYRPVRERSIPTVLGIIRESLAQSGYNELSLASLSIGDYTNLKELVSLITDEFADDGVSVSLPSLRVNSTSLEILEMIGHVRKSGLTFALESPDEDTRLRLNKIVHQKQFREIVDHVVLVGWRLIKLYFMIGLPMSRDEDRRIIDFIKGMLDLYPRLRINVNVSVFVPKPHTPLETERQIDLEHSERLLRNIRNAFQGSRARIKFQNPRMSFVEGILSRGDRRICSLVEGVFRRGERFSSWDEMFDYEKWTEVIEEVNVDKSIYLGGVSNEGDLPWSFIDCRVNRRHLAEELDRARNRVATENCMFGTCSQCGVCEGEVKNRTDKRRIAAPPAAHMKREGESTPAPPAAPARRLLFSFTKRGIYRYISHLDLMVLLIRLGRIAGIPFSYSRGFNPKPRLSLPFALPLGISSEYEIGEVTLSQVLHSDEFVSRMNNHAPDGISVQRAAVTHRKKSVASESYFHDYCIENGADKYLSDLVVESLGSRQAGEWDEVPRPLYTVTDDHIYVRLGGDESIKKIFKQKDRYLDCDIKRIMIWNVRDGKLTSFL
jgi:hypothetical protein